MTEQVDQFYKNCEIIGVDIKPCKAMSETLDGIRLRLTTIVFMKTGEKSREHIVLYSGDHKKNGIVLNFCPWCKEKLHK